MDTDSVIAYIKTDDIYRDITEDVETRLDTSNYELDRPLAKGKNKKVIVLTKEELGKKIKRTVNWNQYKSKIKTREIDNGNPLRILLNASFQGVKILLVLALDDSENDAKEVERNSHQKRFLSKVNIE